MHSSDVKSVEEIPFLPIQFFKSDKIVSNTNQIEKNFLSSGTTGEQISHIVTDISLYEESSRKWFAHFYSNIED